MSIFSPVFGIMSEYVCLCLRISLSFSVSLCIFTPFPPSLSPYLHFPFFLCLSVHLLSSVTLNVLISIYLCICTSFCFSLALSYLSNCISSVPLFSPSSSISLLLSPMCLYISAFFSTFLCFCLPIHHSAFLYLSTSVSSLSILSDLPLFLTPSPSQRDSRRPARSVCLL